MTLTATSPALASEVRAAFTDRTPAGGRQRLGAEIEWLPIVRATGRCAPITGGEGATLPWLRALAARERWRETVTSKGAPRFAIPFAGSITFEPGGQLEYAAPPHRSISRLLARMEEVHDRLAKAADAVGVTLLGAGLDPETPAADAPLRLRSPRYLAMADYLATIGPAGARMMRQTAALQLCVDAGPDPAARWTLLNVLSPVLLGMFANSPRFEGRETGHRSWRAETWRQLDPARTGLPWSADDAEAAYLEFALAAPVLDPVETAGYLPFSEWLERGLASSEQWAEHLSTLFPEVRPRGYFELRSLDTLPRAWYPAALVLFAGLVLDPAAARAAADCAGSPDAGLLPRAGRDGLMDPRLRRLAADLATIGLDGARRLGAGCVHPRDLERAAATVDACIRVGLDPTAAPGGGL